MRGQEVILLNFPISHFFKSFAHSALLTEGGGGVQEPLILADVICEQPLTDDGVKLFFTPSHHLSKVAQPKVDLDHLL